MKRAFTHAGKFHADDVFSSALLKMIYEDIKIERGFKVPEDFDGIVFDIGFGKFDHHQADREVRENGIPYAAFGLLWREYGKLFLEGDAFLEFDEKFVQPMDESDNTGCKHEISDLIDKFNPSWNEEPSDKHFEEAVEFATMILKRRFTHIKAQIEADKIMEENMKKAKDNILILENCVPWKNKLIGTDIYFVVYESKRGAYNAQGVPVNKDTVELHYSFPEAWRGKDEDEIKKVSGIETLRFCHNSGFLIATDTLEDAVKACKIAMM